MKACAFSGAGLEKQPILSSNRKVPIAVKLNLYNNHIHLM